MSIWTYANRFSSTPREHQLTLGEGATPLVRSRSIGPQLGIENLFFKLEMVNPTGSYKDRFAAAAISDMLAQGKTHCVATSSGNTGAALAGYCASAGIRCQIAIVEGAPAGKLSQMLAYGAQLCRVRGFGTDPETSVQVFETLSELGQRPEAALQVSAFHYSPRGMSGVQTLGYELVEQAEMPVDHVFCPAGGGGLTVAVARGCRELASEQGSSPAKVHCVQPEGNDTISSPLRNGDLQGRDVDCTTKVSGLQVANVIDGNEVIAECRPLGGTGYVVTDEHVYTMQRRLAREEGIFCEPAGAVALAGAANSIALGEIQKGELTVCLVTGSGFKDEASVQKMVADDPCPLIGVGEIADCFSA